MNIKDYINNYQDKTFKEEPFNMIDNLVFSYIIYTDLSKCFQEVKSLTIKETSDIFFKLHRMYILKNNRSFIAQAPFVLQLCANTKRYKDVLVTDYVNDFNIKTAEQFSAACFHIDENTVYVSYCGTDDSIIGWKEDFQLSYKLVEAQIKASEYLKNVYQENKQYYIGGHSKGGNLALYASYKANQKIQDSIKVIFSNDGPGLSDQIFNQQQFDAIKHKYIKIIPEFDFIGMIFYQPCNTIVVKSSETLAMQHDLLSWQIEDKQLVRTNKASHLSKVFYDGLQDFFAQTTPKQREDVCDNIFDALQQAHIYYVSDIIRNPFVIRYALPNSLDDLDDSTKKVGQILLNIIKSSIDNSLKMINSSFKGILLTKKK